MHQEGGCSHPKKKDLAFPLSCRHNSSHMIPIFLPSNCCWRSASSLSSSLLSRMCLTRLFKLLEDATAEIFLPAACTFLKPIRVQEMSTFPLDSTIKIMQNLTFLYNFEKPCNASAMALAYFRVISPAFSILFGAFEVKCTLGHVLRSYQREDWTCTLINLRLGSDCCLDVPGLL